MASFAVYLLEIEIVTSSNAPKPILRNNLLFTRVAASGMLTSDKYPID